MTVQPPDPPLVDVYDDLNVTGTLTVTGEGAQGKHTGLRFPGAPVGAVVTWDAAKGHGYPSAVMPNRRMLTIEFTKNNLTVPTTSDVTEFSPVDGKKVGKNPITTTVTGVASPAVHSSISVPNYLVPASGLVLVSAFMDTTADDQAQAMHQGCDIFMNSVPGGFLAFPDLYLKSSSSGMRYFPKGTTSGFFCASLTPHSPLLLRLRSLANTGQTTHGTIDRLNIKVIDY